MRWGRSASAQPTSGRPWRPSSRTIRAPCTPSKSDSRYLAQQLLVMLAHCRRLELSDTKRAEAFNRASPDVNHKATQILDAFQGCSPSRPLATSPSAPQSACKRKVVATTSWPDFDALYAPVLGDLARGSAEPEDATPEEVVEEHREDTDSAVSSFEVPTVCSRYPIRHALHRRRGRPR